MGRARSLLTFFTLAVVLVGLPTTAAAEALATVIAQKKGTGHLFDGEKLISLGHSSNSLNTAPGEALS